MSQAPPPFVSTGPPGQRPQAPPPQYTNAPPQQPQGFVPTGGYAPPQGYPPSQQQPGYPQPQQQYPPGQYPPQQYPQQPPHPQYPPQPAPHYGQQSGGPPQQYQQQQGQPPPQQHPQYPPQPTPHYGQQPGPQQYQQQPGPPPPQHAQPPQSQEPPAAAQQPVPQQQQPQQQQPQQQQAPQPEPQRHMGLEGAEKALQDMQEKGLTNDPRYHQLVEVVEKMRADPNYTIHGAPPQEQPPQQGLSEGQLAQLRAQMSVYRHLARHEDVPDDLYEQAIVPDNIEERRKKLSILPPPYKFPGPAVGSVKELPYSLMHIFEQQQKRSRATDMPKPMGVDPHELMKEREYRIANRIGLRIKELENLIPTVDSDLALEAEIELRSLRLLNFQKQLRQQVVSVMREDTTLETAVNPFAYRRTKRQSLREARVTEKLEKQQKIEQEKKRRQRHQEFLNTVIQHAKEFKDHHRNNQFKMGKVKKAVIQYHANTERERKKEEERREKERLQKLMVEDEAGYRQLLDQKKDKRLVHLLQQTDEYISSLTSLVSQHKREQSNKRRDERRARKRQKRAEREAQKLAEKAAAGEKAATEEASRDGALDLSMTSSKADEETNEAPLKLKVRELATGKISRPDMQGQQIDAWLELHPGFELVSRDEHGGDGEDEEESDSDDSGSGGDSDVEASQPAMDSGEAERILRDDSLDDEQKNRLFIQMQKVKDKSTELTAEDEEQLYYTTAHRIREKVDKQPDLLVGGQLKKYQVNGLEWLVSLYNNNLNGILADEMGLGKTIQTIALLSYLMEKKRLNGPYLIMVPLSTLSNWELEFSRWCPAAKIITFKGNAQNRRSLSSSVRRGGFNVLLTTYDYVMRDKATLSKVRWKYMIIDEGHRMKNHHCKLTQILNTYYTSPHRLLLTGTPLQNKLPELWALLNFLLPSIFKSCSTFEQWFNAPFALTGDKIELNQEESMLVIRRLHKILRPFLLRRMKREVESQLPEKTEYVIKCDMSALQRVLYEELQSKGIMMTRVGQKDSKGKKVQMQAKALMNVVMQLRKLCNHPFLFGEVEQELATHWGIPAPNGQITNHESLYRVAGKFELLDRILPKFRATGHRVLLFCQMTQCMDILSDYFTFRGYPHVRLDGSTKAEDRGTLLEKFNAKDSELFIFLLSTRAGGLGLNLQTADTVILYDSDWNPFQDMQAQARAHRIGQQREVRVLRLITANSVEERVLAAARYKLNIDEKVIQAGMFDQKSTGSERRQVLQAILTADENDEEDDAVPDDDTLNQMIARSDDEFHKFNEMDIERRRKRASECPNKPRLLEASELPDYFSTKAIGDEEAAAEAQREEQEKASYGRGGRSRKEVDYSQDSWTDKQFFKAIEEDIADELSDDEPAPQPSSSKRRRTAGGSSRNRKTKAVEDTPSSSRKRGAPPSSYAEDGDEVSTPARKRPKAPPSLDALLERMLNAIMNYKDSDGRVLSESFYQLPSRKEMPQYYAEVDKPIDFKKIQSKLSTGKYRSLDALRDDVLLLCSNAQAFNEKESTVYCDSLILQQVCQCARGSIQEPGQPAENSDDEVDRPDSVASNEEASRSSVASESRRRRVKKEQPEKKEESPKKGKEEAEKEEKGEEMETKEEAKEAEEEEKAE